MQTVIGDATVVVGPAIFRIDLDRLGAIRNGGDVVLFAFVCLTPVRKGRGVLRAELDGLAVVGNRAVVILPVEGAAAPVLEGLDAFCHLLAGIVDDTAAGRAAEIELVGAGGALARSAGVAASAGIASRRPTQRSSPPDPRAAMLFPSALRSGATPPDVRTLASTADYLKFTFCSDGQRKAQPRRRTWKARWWRRFRKQSEV